MAIPYVKQTWADGSGGGTPLSAARMNNIEQAAYDAFRFPTARVYNNAALAISNNTSTVVTFNTERYDTDTIHDPTTNTGRLTCKTAGVYSIVGRVLFANNSTPWRQLDLRLNGTTIIDNDLDPAPTATFGSYLRVVTQYQLAVNDYLELVALQTSGGSLNILSTANYSPEFMMVRVST